MDELRLLRRTIKGVEFPYSVMVAGGIIKTAEQVKALAPTDVIGEWGSITTKESAGVGGRNYWPHYVEVGGQRMLVCTFNRLALPNPGMGYVEQRCRDLIKLYDDSGKPLVINVSGNGVDDSIELLKRAIACGFRAITCNGACPNKEGQPILCDDSDAVNQYFDRADAEIGHVDAVVLWKISAAMRRPALALNRDRVARSKTFTGMVAGNTVPNGFDYDDEGKTVIATTPDNGTRGGMAGPAILPLALDHVEFCASGMPTGKIVVGCGGISHSRCAMKHFKAGATIVQFNSAYREANENPEFVTDFLQALNNGLQAAA